MVNSEAIDLACEVISQSKKSIIITHINPDGDAIGSSLALKLALNKLNCEATIIVDSDLPHFLQFLYDAKSIEVYSPIIHDRIFRESDTIFCLDFNATKRMRSIWNIFSNSNAKKVLIDHHLEPQDFCNICIIDYEASSTGEIIWRIIKKLGIQIDKYIAEALYVAILTDTGSFRFERTTSEIHRIIAELIDCGANPTELYENVYNQNSYNIVRLLGLALASLELFYDNKLSVMTITDEMFQKTNTNDEDIEGFVEKTLMVKGTKVGILITEVARRSEVRISIRSKGDINVRDFAFRFGGGGHFNAAGVRIYGSDFNSTKKMIIKEAQNLFNQI